MLRSTTRTLTRPYAPLAARFMSTGNAYTYKTHAEIPYSPYAGHYDPFYWDDLKSQLSPTYFTGKPMLHDTLYEVGQLMQRIESSVGQSLKDNEPVKTEGSREQVKVELISLKALRDWWNLPISRDEYRLVISKLRALERVNTAYQTQLSQELAQQIASLLAKFSVSSPQDSAFLANKDDDSALWSEFGAKEGTIDQWGRAYTIGTRRNLRAHVFLTPIPTHPDTHEPTIPLNQPLVLINNQPFTQVFTRWHDRQTITYPMEITDSLLKYTIFAVVESSAPNMNKTTTSPLEQADETNQISRDLDKMGRSAIADAVANGVSKALVLWDQGLEPWLNQAGLLDADERKKERKKPGQPSARAKHQWVRR